MSDVELTSRVPYLFRAMHEWILDNEQTPYVVVDASAKGVRVPDQHTVDNRIILNISNTAVEHLDMTNDSVSFVARFGGVAESIYLPSYAILGIYAKESGEGMIFAADEGSDEPDDDRRKERPVNKPNLRVVK
ncbi:MAG: ClpXP protease specificity-enhancing factor [Gammaproteobacteria bacterium]